MELLNVLLENEGMQKAVQESETQILEAAEVYTQFPAELKTHINENLEAFLGEDVKDTYANMKNFVEGAVFQLLHEMTDTLVAPVEAEAPAEA